MKIRIFLFLLAAGFSLGNILSARAASGSDACLNANSNAQMLDCLSQEYKKEDARLNQSYQGLMKALGAKDQVRLKTAERAWVDYKAKNCDYYAGRYEGGSQAAVSALVCQVDMTYARAQELSTELNQTKNTTANPDGK